MLLFICHYVTVHSVHSNVAKNSFQIACGNGILGLVCLGDFWHIHAKNTSRNSDM